MRVDVIQSYRAVFSFTYFETNECVTFCDILHILRHIVTRTIDFPAGLSLPTERTVLAHHPQRLHQRDALDRGRNLLQTSGN